MNNIKYFLKSNKKQRLNEFYPISKDFVDDTGKVLEWELKPLTSEEVETLRDESFDSKGNFNQNKFLRKSICASVVSPDLNSIELQDSYGVKSAEELIVKLLDCPADYLYLGQKVMAVSKLDTTFADKVAEVKN